MKRRRMGKQLRRSISEDHLWGMMWALTHIGLCSNESWEYMDLMSSVDRLYGG